MTIQNNYFENGILDAAQNHHYRLRVHYADTDAGGVVYHSRYLDFCERARGGWLRCVDLQDVMEENGQKIFWVVRRASLDYQRPARLGDIVEIETIIENVTNATVSVMQKVKCGAQILCVVTLQILLVNEAGRPQRLSPQIRHKLDVKQNDNSIKGKE